MSEPPRLAEWLLARLRRLPDTRYLAGDLAEGFVKRAATNPRAARRWYWSQVMRSLWHRAPAGHDTTAAGPPPRVAVLFREILSARRFLTRRPGPSLLTVATIAIGITATSTLASITYAVLYRPLPWPHADRLVSVWETRDGGTGPARAGLMSGTFNAWRDQASTVDKLAPYIGKEPRTVQGPDGAELVDTAEASPDLFAILGAVPVAGRTLAATDTNAAVVSEPFARRQFGEGGHWLGRMLNLDSRSYIVVGVLPASFAFPSPDTAVWVPLASSRLTDVSLLSAVARLAPGATPAQAAAEGEARARQAPPVADGIQKLFFRAAGPPRVHAATLRDVATRDVRPTLVAALAGVLLLLATAVVSLAGLQLARASERRRELAIRAAMGAGRARVATLLMAEALWLGLAGGLVALAPTWWLLRLAPRWLPSDVPRVGGLSFDVASFLIVAATATVIGVLVGVLPSWHAVRLNLSAVIADESRAPMGFRTGPAGGRSRRLLLVAETGIAVVLLVAAGLSGRTLVNLAREDLGYTPGHLAVARLIGVGANRSARIAPQDLKALMERLDHLPGVTGVALSTALPFQSNAGGMRIDFRIPAPDGSGQQVPAPANENSVTPSYFDLVGLRLITGRVFTDNDYGRQGLFVVNQTFARRYLGDRPLGPFDKGEIIGVVADTRDPGDGTPVEPQIYSLFDPAYGAPLQRPAALYVRSSGNATAVLPMVRAAVHGVDDRLGLAELTTISAQLSDMIARPRLYAVVAGVSAGFALLVAAIGLFSVLWHAVTNRTREIGVRTALGATPRAIGRHVLAEGLGAAAIGAAAGVGTSALLVRYLATLLYHVASHDRLVFAAAPAALLIVATAACLIPARRAARVDPVDALRAP
jgi:putative ABC transport system permease protein